ncbi:MAG: ABC transporter ATP-binding protein [Clostridiaceae bacterium]|nr:ABC transporter ATP-binding protein [Clostridiaceae bacterium]
MKNILEIKNLSFKYSEAAPVILDSINMEIAEGSITAIAGLSGCGKSTLAFCMCGAIPKVISGIVSGNIMYKGEDINTKSLPTLAQKIGIVFQDVDNQLFLPTVDAEIAFAPENLCLSYEEIEKIVQEVAAALGIENLKHKNPSLLSGGEKQLVAIASVLSLNPDVIILDEVLSELDKENKTLIINVIKGLQTSGKTIILIDHSIKNLMIADTILLMKAGRLEDRIEVDEDYELLYNKLSDFFLC